MNRVGRLDAKFHEASCPCAYFIRRRYIHGSCVCPSRDSALPLRVGIFRTLHSQHKRPRIFNNACSHHGLYKQLCFCFQPHLGLRLVVERAIVAAIVEINSHGRPPGGLNAPADAETSSKIALSILFCMVFIFQAFAADALLMHYSLHISCTFSALFLPLPQRLPFPYSPISYHISRPAVNRAAHPDRATAFTFFRPQQLLSDAFFAGLWSRGDVRRGAGGQERQEEIGLGVV